MRASSAIVHKAPEPPDHCPSTPHTTDVYRIRPSNTSTMAGPLHFAPFASEIELPFYSALFASKLDYDKLDDSARSVLGLYQPRSEDPASSCRMQILGTALTSNQYVVQPCLSLSGF